MDPRKAVYALAHLVLIILGFFSIAIEYRFSNAVGSSLIAAGIAGMVVYVYVLVSEQRSRLLGLIREFGFVDAFQERAAKIRPEYERRLNGAREHIDIMGFGLSAMRQDFQDQFAVWAERAHVRILLIDPEFPPGEFSQASRRDLEEAEEQGTIDGQVRLFVRSSKDLIRTHRDFEVRLYKCLPSVNVFRVDDELFWGPYLINQHSRNMPTFVVKSGGVLFRKLTEHFETIWEDERFSRAVPSEWLEEDPP